MRSSNMPLSSTLSPSARGAILWSAGPPRATLWLGIVNASCLTCLLYSLVCSAHRASDAPCGHAPKGGLCGKPGGHRMARPRHPDPSPERRSHSCDVTGLYEEGKSYDD